jgi:pimeloyl-ACP methyl ester carboxylesterase
VNLHVESTGCGPPLVMLHGLGASSSTWGPVRALLDDRYTIITVDLPGHGRSVVVDDPAEYTRDRALEYLDEVLTELKVEAVLVGHSLGGYLTLAYAATRPDRARGLVVLNTGPGFRDPVKRQEWNERSRRNRHRFGIPVQVANLNLQDDSVVMDQVADIRTPLLILAGARDRAEYSAAGAYLVRKMPAARLVVVPGGDHSMHESCAAVIATEIDVFAAALPR